MEPRLEKERAYEKYAWTILLALGIFELAVSITVLVVVFEPDAVLKNTIGMSQSQIMSSTPGVFSYIAYGLRNVGIGVLAASVFELGITLKPYRKGERWAWYILWMWPIAYLASIANDLSVGFLPPAIVLATPISIAGLLLPVRKFFPKK